MPAIESAHILVGDLIARGDLVVNDGYRAKNSELSRHGLPFARAHTINNGFHFEGADCFPLEGIRKVGMKVSEPGDVVFTSKGTVGRFAFVREDTPRFVYAPQLCFWRVLNRERLHPRWLFYWMHSREFFVQFSGVAGQTDMADYVSLRDQRRMHITIPPIKEQRAIAGILGALDDKIELNRRMNRTLEAIARALFKSWFIDFDPVIDNALRAGHPIPDALADRAHVRKRLLDQRPPLPPAQDFHRLFPDTFTDSDLGPIPEGWEVATLGTFASLNPESWSKKTRPETIRYVDLSNTKWGQIEKVVVYARQDAPSRAQRLLRTGDTILGTVRPGNGSYAFVAEKGLTGSTGFAVLRPRNAEWTEFIYLAATAGENIERLAHLADGAAYPAVRPEIVAATPVVQPNGRVLGRFSGLVAPLLGMMARREQESRTLASIRDTLLPKLLSGEIDVSAPESLADLPVWTERVN